MATFKLFELVFSPEENEILEIIEKGKDILGPWYKLDSGIVKDEDSILKIDSENMMRELIENGARYSIEIEDRIETYFD